jgi:type IV secretory pathway VirB2 component (pilin)
MLAFLIKAVPASSALSPDRLHGLARSALASFRSKTPLQRLATFALAAIVLTTVCDPAFAQVAGGGGNITTFLQNIVNIITGTAGKLIAVLAICFVGIGALMGALSLRAAGGVILGVMLIFSASWIVTQITGAV